MSGPLDGYRVLELTSTVSGPVAGMILADQGADVIKIEPPMIGDLARFMGDTRNGMAAMFSTLNRNKRSLVLDLKDEDDLQLFLALVPTADILIENYRPGIVARLAIDHETLMAIHPGLIYVSISGYGQSGPYKDRRVYDPLIQATTGTAAAQNVERPGNVRTVIFDKVTGYTAAQAITAALLQRHRTGRGQYLPISMLQSALYFQWPDFMWSHTLLGEDISKAGELADYFQIFRCADSYLAIILVADDAFQQTCDAIGSELFLDPRFATLPARLMHRDELQIQLDAALAECSADPLCEELDRRGVPVARSNEPKDVASDPQVVQQSAIVEVEHPVAGLMQMADTPCKFEGQGSIAERHAPLLGQHSVEILEEIGASREQLTRIEEREKANRELMAGFSLSKQK